MVITAAVFIFIIISLVLVKFWGNLTDGSPYISQVPTKLSLSCNSFKIILVILKPGPTPERELARVQTPTLASPQTVIHSPRRL